jgi:hypothetical protein
MAGNHFAMIPVEVLTSDACCTLPNYAVRVLLAIAAQYRGKNNGDLAMTRATAREFGITSQEHLVTSLSALLERGLIQKTRQGGKKPLGPSLYAVTWQPIDDLAGKIEAGATMCAANTWAKWSSSLPTEQSTENHRVCRRTTSGLPADQKVPISGLPAEQKGTFIGSAGSPPSRSWCEGRAVEPVVGSDSALVAPVPAQRRAAVADIRSVAARARFLSRVMAAK